MIRYSLRLPDDLHQRLVELAERERRSLNEQIVFMLENGLLAYREAPLDDFPKPTRYPAEREALARRLARYDGEPGD